MFRFAVQAVLFARGYIVVHDLFPFQTSVQYENNVSGDRQLDQADSKPSLDILLPQ